MAAPRAAVNPLTHSVGLSSRLVTISAVTPDGMTAVCTDRTGAEVRVPLMNQRAKGLLPQQGENWLVGQEYGFWSFMTFIGSDAASFPQLPAVPDTWHSFTLLSLFARRGPAYSPPQYTRTADGSVLLAGEITGDMGGDNTAAIGALPYGYHSTKYLLIKAVTVASSQGIVSGGTGRMQLDTAGGLTLLGLLPGACTVSLDGLLYPVTAA